jgi:hypothetical protein
MPEARPVLQKPPPPQTCPRKMTMTRLFSTNRMHFVIFAANSEYDPYRSSYYDHLQYDNAAANKREQGKKEGHRRQHTVRCLGHGFCRRAQQRSSSGSYS